MYTPTSQRSQYAANEFVDDKRNDRNSYDERTRLEYEDSPQPPQTPQARRMSTHHNERVKFKYVYYFYQILNSMQSIIFS